MSISMFTGGTRVKICSKLLIVIVGFYLIIRVFEVVTRHKDIDVTRHKDSFPKPKCEKGEQMQKTSVVLATQEQR